MPDCTVPAKKARKGRREDAVQKSETRFRQVLELASNAMAVINGSGRIEMVNAEAERVFGYSRTELLGQPAEMLVPERFRDHDLGSRLSLFDVPQSRAAGERREPFGLRKTGDEFPMEIDLHPIEMDEGAMVLSTIVDISDRRRKEERIRVALNEKELLLAEIHHRVKNNLQVIHSLLDLQSWKIDDKAALRLIVECQNRIKSMALIHQMLHESDDFARVDFNRFLEALVPGLVSSYGADPGRIRLSIHTTRVSMPIKAAIPCGLIVNELISNALKHAFPAGGCGEIEIHLSAGGDDEIVLSVADDGVGVSGDVDFANATTLGLQLVTLLADQLGGDVTMERLKPTRFIVRFKVET